MLACNFYTNVLTGPFIFEFNYFVGSALIGTENAYNFPNSIESLTIINIFDLGYSFFFSLMLGGFITGLPSAISAAGC